MNLINRIDKYFLDKENRPRRSHHPSDLTACMRQLWYKWMNEEPSNPPEPGVYYKFEMGKKSEDIITDWLEYEKQNGWIDSYSDQEEIEFEVDGCQKKVHGYIDFVFTKDEKKYGVELKTSFGQGIKQIQKSGEPKPEHLMQIYPYMRQTGIHTFFLLYIGRDNGYRTQFICEYDKDGIIIDFDLFYKVDWEAIEKKLYVIESMVSMQEKPERDYKACIVEGEFKRDFTASKVKHSGDWQCAYCDFRSKCWENILKQPGKWVGERRIV